MNQITASPISVREFIYMYQTNENLFDIFTEFAFIKPLAAKWKSQGCACGLGPDIKIAIDKFNEVVINLLPETISKIASHFPVSVNQVCFSIQTKDSQTSKCYQYE